MPEDFCDCGFAIPEGASFCPGCGKPLTTEAREKERVANAFQPPAGRQRDEAGPVHSVDFGTPGALRSCYWSAAFAAILMSFPVVNLLCFVIYPAAGFYTVHSFRRRTKREVSVGAGAKLGLLTGVIAFALMLILMALTIAMPGSPGLAAELEQSANFFDEQGQPQLASQVRALRDDRGALAFLLLMSLAFGFVLTAGFTTAGGALGAKVLEKE